MFWMNVSLLSSTPANMEVICCSETLVSTYKATRRHSPENYIWQFIYCLNLYLLFCSNTDIASVKSDGYNLRASRLDMFVIVDL
jgi:hypothetical protein